MAIPQREPTEPSPLGADRLDYYVVKIRRSAVAPGSGLAGIVERLGSGEKREFTSCAELARLVEDWSR
ncbi:MAG TPA: hypothetical protein VGP61_05580 [Gemmatimonadales bacterium]|jgi:hypothetical protein|nr:hypothetical protein [Gemmatimonadales bacterium]